MVAEEQVCVLYAGVRGYLDKVQTSEIGKFEKLFLDHLKSKHTHIIESIRTEKALSDKTNAELKQILEDFIPTAGLQMKAWANMESLFWGNILLFKLHKILLKTNY